MRRLRSASDNQAALESGPHAGEAPSATMGGEETFAPIFAHFDNGCRAAIKPPRNEGIACVIFVPQQ